MATKVPFGDLVLAAQLPATTGKYFFVHSGTGSNGNSGLKPERALASIDAAVGKCTADKGDVIVVMPGHTETVSAANGLDLDVAGIHVYGVSNGGLKPTVNLTATASTVRVNANSVKVSGLLFTGGIDAIVKAIDINGKTDVTFEDCEFRDVTGQTELWVTAANNSDRLTLRRVRVVAAAAAGPVSAFKFDGCDDLLVEDFHIQGNFSTAAIDFATTASLRVTIRRGYIWTQNAADIAVKDTITGSTGAVGPDLEFMLTDNAANITEAITGATFHQFDPIYVCNLAGEKAMLINTTASTDV